MHKRIKTKKVKTSEECNEKELNNNNDYNYSNRKGKALKVATKKTLKIKKYFLPDFLKRYCLKVLAVSFSKNQLSLFCCKYFLFSYYCHYCNHYYSFFILIFYFIFKIFLS